MNVVDEHMVIEAFGSLEEVMYHLKNNIKTKLGVSPIHGVGVFAICDINKGEQIFQEWNKKTGIYIVPNNRLSELSPELLEMLDMYFINEECGYKIIRLFKGLNFLSNNYSYCNSSLNTGMEHNISNDGVALRDIKKGEEILEWYNENIYE